MHLIDTYLEFSRDFTYMLQANGVDWVVNLNLIYRLVSWLMNYQDHIFSFTILNPVSHLMNLGFVLYFYLLQSDVT